ncbi:MAG TPA: efflux RND transporter periplasmic adaptor subunit [bacterium]|nr:efflux RND transporter periplasmic adaptor subunit [bacterium]
MKILTMVFIIFFMLLQSCSKQDEKSADQNEKISQKESGQKGVGKKEKDQMPRKVRVREIKPETLTRKIFLNGVIEAQRDVTITTKTTGEIVSINFDLGKFVKKGEILAVIEHDLQKNALEQAEVSLRQAELNHELRKTIFERDSRLYENKALSREQYDVSENSLRTTELALEQSSTALQTAQVNYDNCFIKAPFDGVIADRPVQQGQYVTIGSPVARVVDTANLQVIVGLTQKDLLVYKQHRKKDVDVIISELLTIPGTVVGVGDAPDKKTSLYSMKITFKSMLDDENRRIIFPGMQIGAGIKAEVFSDSFYLNRSEMRLSGKDYFIFVEKEGKAVRKEVEVLTDAGKEWVVRLKDKPEKSFRLIVSGIEALNDGRAVEIVEEE